jgi:hypothetical protein
MPVSQVSGRVRLEPRHVYVIPPNRQLMVPLVEKARFACFQGVRS